VEQYPGEPLAYLYLSLAYLEANDRAKAEETLQTVLDGPDLSTDTLLRAANVLDQHGSVNEATLLYSIALAKDPTDPDSRAQAGEYLYTRAVNADRTDVTTFCRLLGYIPASPYLDAILGQSLLSAYVIPRRAVVPADCPVEAGSTAEELITRSADHTPEFAEAFLILGNFYEKTGDLDQAREQWNHALTLPDVPRWVRDQVESKQ
jgi:Tfp pilus assembly protein PilF